MKRNSRYYLLHGIILSTIGVMCILGYMITTSLNQSEEINKNIEYVSYEILTDNVMPVIKEKQEEVNNEITKPYTDETVEIGRPYYDSKKDEKEQQESIIYYENTYIQNTGVDYVSKNVFNVNTIADGTIMSISEDDITGKTIKIKHNNNLISVYQSVKEVLVKENDTVTKGQIIASSGTNNIGSDLGNHLHFELYEDNKLVNPEEYFSNSEGN